jgi:hypothetical protein
MWTDPSSLCAFAVNCRKIAITLIDLVDEGRKVVVGLYAFPKANGNGEKPLRK